MSAHRFYVPGMDLKQGLELELPAAVGHQVTRVFRMREGDLITLFDGSGPEWAAKITAVRRDQVLVIVEKVTDPRTESRLEVTICQSLVAHDRMEYAIQKCTELGAARFQPVVSERVQAKDARPTEKRYSRWNRIAIEAAEQCGRTRVLKIMPARSLDTCIADMAGLGPLIALWEEEHGAGLRAACQVALRSTFNHVAVLIGPVGGLSESEVEAASAAGALVAGAGPRILRAETAPVVALTALMYEAGELE